ncbi:hypothetical protein Ancab_031386 [Ancistrocladus abbreviatus]
MADKPCQAAAEDVSEIAPFDPTKKKKKTKKVMNQHSVNGFMHGLGVGAEDLLSRINEEDDKGGVASKLKEGSGQDYEYRELLCRLFSILRDNNPELIGERRMTVLKPPEVLQEGTRTVFVNFMDLCKTMHRQPEDVMAFILSMVGTHGSLDRQLRLVVKGRFTPNNVEEILRKYINEYVVCGICRSPDTNISKQSSFFVLSCEQCGSERSVAPIIAD